MSTHVTTKAATPKATTQPHRADWITNSGAAIMLAVSPGKRTNRAQMFEIQRILSNAEAEIARHLNHL